MEYTVNGKKVTKTEQKFLDTLMIRSEGWTGTVTNPFSGDSCTLNSLQEAVYSYVIGAQMQPWWAMLPPAQGWTKEQKKVIQNFSLGLDMFRKYWASEYMTLLD